MGKSKTTPRCFQIGGHVAGGVKFKPDAQSVLPTVRRTVATLVVLASGGGYHRVAFFLDVDLVVIESFLQFVGAKRLFKVSRKKESVW